MEILYQLNLLNDLHEFPAAVDISIRWLEMPGDYSVFCTHLKEHYADTVFMADVWPRWEASGISYCGLFKDDKMVARAAVEKYSEDAWETADMRVWRSERGNGYAKQICSFVTKYILVNYKTATCRTEEDNIAMQRVIYALGFDTAGPLISS